MTALIRLMAEDSPSSLQTAIAAAEPGSAAASYFFAWLLNLRAYVDIGGRGLPLQLIPLKGGGVAFCWRDQGKPICMQYQDPSFAADTRLSGFTVNGVDVARLVRLGTDVPAAQLQIAPGISAHVIALRCEPLDVLTVVLEVQNDTDATASLPKGTDFTYRRDGSGASAPSTSYAMPATVAPHSSTLLALAFHGANFGGTLVLAGAGAAHELHIPGPPVALPNTAAERA